MAHIDPPTPSIPRPRLWVVTVFSALLISLGPSAVGVEVTAGTGPTGSVTGVNVSSPSVWPATEDGDQSIAINVTVSAVGSTGLLSKLAEV